MTVNGDTITGVTETSTGTPVSAQVGTYPIVPAAATGNRLSNYTITYVNGTLTVNPAPLTITANNESKPFGTVETFSPTAFTEVGLVTVNGDTITGVTETSTGAPASAPVGTYPIVPSAATGNRLNNYTITYVNGTLTVNQSIIVLDPTAGGALSLSGNASINARRRRLRRFQLVECPVGQRQRPDQGVGDRRARRRPEERQRELQPRPGHGGGGRCRPAGGAGVAEHVRTDELWLREPERQFVRDDQARHLQPDQRLGQRQADPEQRHLHHRGGRLHGLRQRQRHAAPA